MTSSANRKPPCRVPGVCTSLLLVLEREDDDEDDDEDEEEEGLSIGVDANVRGSPALDEEERSSVDRGLKGSISALSLPLLAGEDEDEDDEEPIFSLTLLPPPLPPTSLPTR